ncbi:trithorax group protein osa-like isoform X1 [Artemia franciscana]|uniref:trithorax group protein osa-like isoform X1 n=1 Tax=Artemia franciscana TaxID=6661 RepID=UPI0032D9CE59
MESSGVNGVRGPEVNHQGYPYQGYPQPYPTKQPPCDPGIRTGIPHNPFPPHLRPGGPPGPSGPSGHHGQWGLPPRVPSPYGSQTNSQHPAYNFRPTAPQQVQNNLRPGFHEQFQQYRYPAAHNNNAPSPISSPGPQQQPSTQNMENNHQHSQPPNGTASSASSNEQQHPPETQSPGPAHPQSAPPPAKRPSPSPTGSSGSASSQPMSPAIGNVGALQPRPPSRQDAPPQHGQQPNIVPLSQGSYGQGPMPPPHLGSYPPGKAMPGYHPHPQHYPPGPPQGPAGSYPPQRPQMGGQYPGYSPQQSGMPGPPVSQPYGASGPPRPGGPGQYGQYSTVNYAHPGGQYPQQWVKQQGLGQPPMQQSQVSVRTPSPAQPVQYLRHQLQQKVGYSNQPHSGNPPLTPPHPGYPTSGGNLLSPTPQHPPSPGPNASQITVTGPDGAGIDEASQQSTLSNASQASGEDGPPTPRSRQANTTPLGFPGSHPATPSSGTAPSPGMVHDDFNDANSPGQGWGRSNVSPVFNIQQADAPKFKRGALTEGIQKLYEFDDHPDRRPFVDQLLRFMEDEGHPITSCPSISKNPLDLFKLYIMVRERGGFIEVTKNKTWKDIAGQLGIGASSSAAYTLRKHYTRNLLRWECRFDRGGIDPNPIISQYETTSHKKKKNAEQAAAAAAATAAAVAPHDGYGGHPMGHPGPHSGPPGQHPGHPPSSHPGYPMYSHPGAPPVGEYHGHPPVPHGAHHPPVRGQAPVIGDNMSASNPFDDMPTGGSVQPYPRPPGPSVPPSNFPPNFGPGGHPARPPHPQGFGAPGQYPPYGAEQQYKAPPSTSAPVSQEFPPTNAQSQYPPPPTTYTLPTRTLYPPYGASAPPSATPEPATSNQTVSQPSQIDPSGFRYPTPAQGVLPQYQQGTASANPAPSASPGLAPTRAMSPAPPTPGPSPGPVQTSHTPIPPVQVAHSPSEANGPSAEAFQVFILFLNLHL